MLKLAYVKIYQTGSTKIRVSVDQKLEKRRERIGDFYGDCLSFVWHCGGGVSSTGDMAKAGFGKMMLDLSSYCMKQDLEDLGKDKKREKVPRS